MKYYRIITKCHLTECNCPVCGKMFIPAPLHAYKSPKTRVKYCSWTCYRKAQKTFPKDFIKTKKGVKD